MSRDPAPGTETVLHASCVAVAGRAALIRGAAGSGKSGLALQLLTMGALLVADDRTRVWRSGARLLVAAPDPIRGRIEARGIGILGAPATTAPVPLALIVDMDAEETERLPPDRRDCLLGLSPALVRKSTARHFPAAILLYLKHGRLD